MSAPKYKRGYRLHLWFSRSDFIAEVYPDWLRGKRVWVKSAPFHPDRYTDAWRFEVQLVEYARLRFTVPEGMLYRHREPWM